MRPVTARICSRTDARARGPGRRSPPTRRPGAPDRALDPPQLEHELGVPELVDAHLAGAARARHQVRDRAASCSSSGGRSASGEATRPARWPGSAAEGLAGQQLLGVDRRQAASPPRPASETHSTRNSRSVADRLVDRRGGRRPARRCALARRRCGRGPTSATSDAQRLGQLEPSARSAAAGPRAARSPACSASTGRSSRQRTVASLGAARCRPDPGSARPGRRRTAPSARPAIAARRRPRARSGRRDRFPREAAPRAARACATPPAAPRAASRPAPPDRHRGTAPAR